MRQSKESREAVRETGDIRASGRRREKDTTLPATGYVGTKKESE